MDDQAANADAVGRIDDAARGILEQGAAQAIAVLVASHRETPEHHYRKRIRHVAAKMARRGGWRDCRGCQGVEANDPGLFAHDEGTRRTAELIGHGAALEPGIERFDPAVESCDVMVEREQLRGAWHLLQAAGQGALARMVFRNFSFGCAG